MGNSSRPGTIVVRETDQIGSLLAGLAADVTFDHVRQELDYGPPGIGHLPPLPTRRPRGRAITDWSIASVVLTDAPTYSTALLFPAPR
ncbi:hypothetical protein [Streptomyces sp. NRRL S-350]|uniref:hypothetical protein n=1 Tax=Streptomyces sp. NRRL S-350 TaxID=1463902 RepID=UPI0004BEA56C|nr:hypothetical protein [Streptomyces sp. NRRL S-350]